MHSLLAAGDRAGGRRVRRDRPPWHDHPVKRDKQATWNGHPLYTYIGDTGSGMEKGNGLNLSGGVWHAITLTGHAAPAASPKASSGGGGYGY